MHAGRLAAPNCLKDDNIQRRHWLNSDHRLSLRSAQIAHAKHVPVYDEPLLVALTLRG